MSNLWQGDEEEPFEDRPDEINLDANGIQMQSPPAAVKNPPRPTTPVAAPVAKVEVEEEMEAEEEQDDYSTVLSDARLRLEQGRLYEMIMNNDLF